MMKEVRSLERIGWLLLAAICVIFVAASVVGIADQAAVAENPTKEWAQEKIMAQDEARDRMEYQAEQSREHDEWAQLSREDKVKAIVDEETEVEVVAVQETKINAETIAETKVVKKKEPSRGDVLLDTYKYCLKDTAGKQNDITVELLDLGERLMKDKGLDPNLLFGIIMVESEGHADATNKYSGAAGLGQFIPSTGKWIYEDKMGGSGYNHAVTPHDPEINIRMMVTYLGILKTKYSNNTLRMLQEYCGGDADYTYRYYTKVCRAVGYCID